MRVLHLIDPATGGWTALEALSQRLRAGVGETHACVIIGTASDAATARRLGLSAHDRIHAPLRSARLAAPGLRRLLDRRPTPDLIHAWSLESLTLAAIVRPRIERHLTITAPPQCATPAIAMAGPALAILRRRTRAAPSRIAFLNEHLRRQWADKGMRRLIARSVIDVAPPEPDCAPCLDRETLRTLWGAGPEDFVVALLGEPASALDARRLVTVTGPLAVAGRKILCLAPAGARGIERARRYMARIGLGRSLISCSPLPWSALPGADAGIWLGTDAAPGVGAARRPDPGTRSLAWAAALNLPVVAEDRPEARDAAQGSDSIRYSTPGRPLNAARALLEITDRSREHHAARS